MTDQPAIKTVAFLQNQWFKDPDRIRQWLDGKPKEDRPRFRRMHVATALFAGCLTGRRIRKAFGDNIMHQVLWENASPQIASKSSGRFKPDLGHVMDTIMELDPDIILAFGRLAEACVKNALAFLHGNGWQLHRQLMRGDGTGRQLRLTLITGPHPAARGANTKIALGRMADQYHYAVAGLKARRQLTAVQPAGGAT